MIIQKKKKIVFWDKKRWKRLQNERGKENKNQYAQRSILRALKMERREASEEEEEKTEPEAEPEGEAEPDSEEEEVSWQEASQSLWVGSL